VVDAAHAPLAGALVSADWGGLLSESASGSTGADGVAVLSSKKTRKTGEITFRVSDIFLTGYVYDPGSDESIEWTVMKP
jgi:hypothetical protein